MSEALSYPRITHDHFFKKLMARDEVVCEFLEEYLPQDIVSHVDLHTMERLPSELKGYTKDHRYVDVAVRVHLKDNSGHVIVLIEHQSRSDRLMPLRILEYSCYLMRQYLVDAKSQPQSLPIIYPMVIYQGRRVYQHSRDIRDLVEGPESLVKRYFLQPFHLVDLARIPDEKLKRREWSGALLLTLKHVVSKDSKEVIGIIERAKLLSEKYDLRELLDFVVEYVTVNSVADDTYRLARLIRKKLHQSTGEATMGRLIDVFIEEGLQKGMQQGMQQGMRLGKQEVVKNMLANHLSEKVIRDVTDFDIPTIHKIRDEMRAEKTKH